MVGYAHLDMESLTGSGRVTGGQLDGVVTTEFGRFRSDRGWK